MKTSENLKEIEKDTSTLMKRFILLLTALALSIVSIVTIFYVMKYLPANESNALVEKIKYTFFVIAVTIMAILIYSEKNIRTVETIEQMKNRFDIRIASMVLSVMIIAPSTILVQHYFPITKSSDTAFIMLVVLIMFEGLVTRSAVAGYVFKKIGGKTNG